MYSKRCGLSISSRNTVASTQKSDSSVELLDHTVLGASLRDEMEKKDEEEEEEDLYVLQSRFKSLHFLDGGRRTKVERVRRCASFPISSVREGGRCEDGAMMWRFSYRRLGARHGGLPRYHKMPLEEYHTLDAEERVMNFSTTKVREVTTDSVPEERRTSVMLRSIPLGVVRHDIIHLLRRHDFLRDINFIYTPLIHTF